MDGQGRTLGGAILGKTKKIEDDLQQYYRHTGPSMSPFNAWVVLKGLETMDLRVRRMSDNARTIADRLAGNPKIAAVRYPGRTRPSAPQRPRRRRCRRAAARWWRFSIKGGRAAAYATLNKLGLVDISNNLGDSKSLITHPATTTHRTLTEDERAAIGLDDTWLRLSVGLEDPEDIAEDLEQALALEQAGLIAEFSCDCNDFCCNRN